MGAMKKNRYTNKEFKDNFVNLASNKVKLGHLTQKRDVGDNQVVEGILKQIIKDKIETDGWLVEVGNGKNKSTYKCSNTDPFNIPPSTETKTMYVPIKKVKVEFIMDKFNKIYTITRMITNRKIPLSLYNDQLQISVDNNNKTNGDVRARIGVSKQTINLTAESIVVQNLDEEKIDLIEAHQNNVEEIAALKQQNASLIDEIQEIKNQLVQINTQDEE